MMHYPQRKLPKRRWNIPQKAQKPTHFFENCAARRGADTDRRSQPCSQYGSTSRVPHKGPTTRGYVRFLTKACTFFFVKTIAVHIARAYIKADRIRAITQYVHRCSGMIYSHEGGAFTRHTQGEVRPGSACCARGHGT
jgi:hypothetical protein